jgi:hypothetical protein
MRSFTLAVLIAIAAALAPMPAAAAPAATADLFSTFRAVRVVGDRLYAASRAGLAIYDVSDRAHPAKLSQLFLDRSGSFKLEVSGDYVFVLSGEIVYEESLLRVVDVSDPTAPRVVAEYSDLTDARVQAMLVVGNVLALGDANAVDLVDVSDPTSPHKLSTLAIASEPEQVVSLVANGSTLFAAYIGLGGEGLVGAIASIDVSDPSAPREVGSFATEGSPNSMTGVGDTLYLGETLTAVLVVDASDPASLVEVTRIDFPLTGQVDVFARGDRLFTGASTDDANVTRVGVYDITNPRAPVALAETAEPCQVAGMAYDAATTDAFLPCADATGSGASIFDVTAAGALDEFAGVRVPEVYDVAVSADATFLAASDSLVAVRPANGAGAAVLGRLALGQRALTLRVVGARAYVFTADNTIGVNAHVRIVDVSDPTDMRLLGSLAVDDIFAVYTAKRFDVVDETLYVADSGGLEVYDVADAAAPRQVGSVRIPNGAENVLVVGTTAYVNALRVVDNVIRVDLYVVSVKRPTKPKVKAKLRDLDSANFVSDLAAKGDRLYLLDAGQGNPFGVAGDGRILVLDIAKKRPRVISTSATSPSLNGYAREIAIDGETAYVADGLDGVSVLSLAGDTPEFLRAIDTPGFANGVALDAAGAVSVADQSSYQVYAPAAGAAER